MSNNRKATRGRKHVMRPDNSKKKMRSLKATGYAQLSKIVAQ